jgi:predicted RecB family nuclease
MRITPAIFDAFLKCATKCHLRSLGEIGSGNEYADWVRGQNESYQREAARRLQEAVPETERVVAPPATENLKAAKWRLAVDLTLQIPYRPAHSQVREAPPNEEIAEPGGPCAEQLLESRLHAVERVPSEGRGKPAQFVPIRFVFRNKLTKEDRLLLAFDALVLSEVLGRAVSLGKIIHGDDHATLKVKTSALAAEVRKRLEKLAVLLSSPAPPDLVLNRHCAECEFQPRCRKIAVEKDDLSLLARMSAKERQELRSKGIFTITQLSYTFRPRLRPKRLRDKREKYHHSLKALAIREKKIHVVGSPELKIEGTPVYLDVEGLPDRDFYYLIGVRIGNGESAVQHSLWADTVEDEGKIWREFLDILETIEKPVLIHYGGYETTFLKQMSERYNSPQDESVSAKAIGSPVNLISVIFARTYFPTFSNGLKEIAYWLGFRWSTPNASGAQTVAWRQEWQSSREPQFKKVLATYNREDCQALALVCSAIQGLRLTDNQSRSGQEGKQDVVCAESLKRELPYHLGNKTFALPELEEINKAAYWNYQREHVYVRSGKRVRRKRKNRPSASNRVNKVILCPPPTNCPHCNRTATHLHAMSIRTLYDLQFGRFSIKRWITKYVSQICRCPKCNLRFGLDERFHHNLKFGWNLVAFFLYQVIELRISQNTVTQSLNDLFGYNLSHATAYNFKSRAANFYKETQREILNRIVRGTLVHVDETRANIKGKLAYVWVLTNLREVAYIYAETREGEMIQSLLGEFKGVLVSDFYAAYDTIPCPQQKCLIHLMRDLNDQMLDNPFDEELKRIITGFAELLRPIVQTVDRYGLKRHFLRKHLASVERFYKKVIAPKNQSEAAIKCKQRFEKNRDRLFTFLDFDGVPWNNNNAEHAIKAFGALRDVVGGLCTVKGIEEYLTLLTVCETCEYSGVGFRDFIRSGEKDIHAFAESRRGRRRRTQTSQPAGLLADAIPGPSSQP